MFAARLICSWIGAFGLAAGAYCQTYVQINLCGIAPACAPYVRPMIINNAGTIAGDFSANPLGTSSFRNVGFVRHADGTWRTIGIPPASVGGTPTDMNAAGAVTGAYRDLLTLVIHGFVLDPAGKFLSFDVPGAFSTGPHSINAGGAVTGLWYYGSFSSPGPNHGFLRDADGTITTFDVPESIATVPGSINAVGVITGAYQTADGTYHGFVRDPAGYVTSFDPPGSTGTSPVSMNYSGAITGSYTKADGRSYGFVRDADGTITSFDPGFNTRAQSINSRGVILGNYTNSTGNSVSSFVRSADGTITLLLDQPNFCPHGLGLARSINEGGVITGDCYVNQIVQSAGWVRYP